MDNNVAYITEANFWRITKNNKIKNWENKVYKYKGEILFFIRTWDLIDLNKHSLFLKKMTEWEDWFYEKIERNRDTYSKVYEWWQSAYHLYKDCSKLSSDFENYEIPEILFKEIVEERSNWLLNEEEYRNTRKKIAQKYRVWFKKNWTNSEKFESVFWLKLKKWFKKIKYDNSWIKEFENMTLEDIEKKIDEKIWEQNYFMDNLSDKEKFFIKSLWKYVYYFKDIKEEWYDDIFWKIVYKYHKVWINKETFSDFDYFNLLKLLREYDEIYLKEIKKMLKKYINIINNNYDFKFNISLLDNIGFKVCHECEERQNKK